MGRRAARIAAMVAAVLLVAGAATALAGRSSTKVRAPKIGRIFAPVASKRAAISATINAENLETTYQVALLYRPVDCCTPGSKECCAPEVEVIATGKLPGSSTPREIHASARLREGSYSIRVRVEAENSVGSREKSRALHPPRA